MSAVIFLQVHIIRRGRPFSIFDRVPSIDIKISSISAVVWS